MQFRPVSESFDFNINERDMFMTRSAVMYDDLNMSDLNGGQNVFDGSNIDVMVGDSISMGFEERDNSVNSDHADITQVKSLPTSPNSSGQNSDDKKSKDQSGQSIQEGKLQTKSAPCMPLKEDQEDQHHQSLHSENNDTINLETTSLLDETDTKACSLNSSHVEDSDSLTPKKDDANIHNEPTHISSTSSSSVTSSSISASDSNKLNIKNDDNNNSLSSSSLSFNEHSIDY